MPCRRPRRRPRLGSRSRRLLASVRRAALGGGAGLGPTRSSGRRRGEATRPPDARGDHGRRRAHRPRPWRPARHRAARPGRRDGRSGHGAGDGPGAGDPPARAPGPPRPAIHQPTTDVVALDRVVATNGGWLLAAAGTADGVDAHVVCANRQQVVTSDPDDLSRLDPRITCILVRPAGRPLPSADVGDAVPRWRS